MSLHMARDIVFVSPKPGRPVPGGVGRSASKPRWRRWLGRNRRGHRVAASHVLGYARDDAGRFGLVVETFVCQTDDEGRVIEDQFGTAEEESIGIGRLERESRAVRIAAI